MEIIKNGESQSGKSDDRMLGVVLLSLFLVAGGYVAAWGGWWWLLAVPLVLLGVVGANEETKR